MVETSWNPDANTTRHIQWLQAGSWSYRTVMLNVHVNSMSFKGRRALRMSAVPAHTRLGLGHTSWDALHVVDPWAPVAAIDLLPSASCDITIVADYALALVAILAVGSIQVLASEVLQCSHSRLRHAITERLGVDAAAIGATWVAMCTHM